MEEEDTKHWFKPLPNQKPKGLMDYPAEMVTRIAPAPVKEKKLKRFQGVRHTTFVGRVREDWSEV